MFKMSFISFSTYNKLFKHNKHKRKNADLKLLTCIIPTRLPVAIIKVEIRQKIKNCEFHI